MSLELRTKMMEIVDSKITLKVCEILEEFRDEVSVLFHVTYLVIDKELKSAVFMRRCQQNCFLVKVFSCFSHRLQISTTLPTISCCCELVVQHL